MNILTRLLFSAAMAFPAAHAATLAELELTMDQLIQEEGPGKKMTLILESDSGYRFVSSVEDDPDSILYLPDSTTKWITTLVILDLVNRGYLSLDDTAAELLGERSDWPQSGNLGAITLRHLLSQTSGLVDNPSCSYLPYYSMDGCVKQIARIHEQYSDNPDYAPGHGFFYAYSHFQVAGLMAVEAAQRHDPERSLDWEKLFRDFKARTGLMPHAFYIIPYPWNPMLSGGMSWKAFDYHDAMKAIYHGQVLSPELITEMLGDQTSATVEDPDLQFALNPMYQGYEIAQMHYGLGNWVEGDVNANGEWESWGRNSSGGLFGTYPFISQRDGYFGILARQGMPRTFDDAYAFFQRLQPLIEEWAALANQVSP